VVALRPLNTISKLRQKNLTKKAVSLGLAGNNPQEETSPLRYKEKAIDITKAFHRGLIQHRLHLSRADLPKGTSEEAKHKRNTTLKKWVYSASVLLQQLEGDDKLILQVLEWYFAHRRNKYVSDIRSMPTFCEKFFRLEKVMRQSEGMSDEPTNYKLIVEQE